MTREKWIQHIVKVTGVEAPSPVRLATYWNTAVADHQRTVPSCRECSARRRALRAERLGGK
jgi:hypothetical protein